MSQRDRTTVDVHLLLIEPQLTDDDKALRRERLVQLDEVEVVHIDAGASAQLSHCETGAHYHHARIDTRNCTPDETSERFDAEISRLFLARDHERGGAVVDAARIPGGDRAAVRAERRLQRRELLGARVGPGMLVALDTVHGHELVVETARLGGCGPPLL